MSSCHMASSEQQHPSAQVVVEIKRQKQAEIVMVRYSQEENKFSLIKISIKIGVVSGL